MITDGVTVTEKDEIRMARKLNNWLILSKFITQASEEDILKLLVMEIRGRQRFDIIHRLHSRYNSKRRDREKTEIVTRLRPS